MLHHSDTFISGSRIWFSVLGGSWGAGKMRFPLVLMPSSDAIGLNSGTENYKTELEIFFNLTLGASAFQWCTGCDRIGRGGLWKWSTADVGEELHEWKSTPLIGCHFAIVVQQERLHPLQLKTNFAKKSRLEFDRQTFVLISRISSSFLLFSSLYLSTCWNYLNLNHFNVETIDNDLDS